MINSEKVGSVFILKVKNIDEAKRKLFDLYGHDYSIVNKRSVPQSGLKGFFQKDILEVTYVLKNRTTIPNNNSFLQSQNNYTSESVSSDNFLKNRDELLKKNGSSIEVSTINSQFGELSKQLKELSEQVKANNSSNFSEIHPSIQKIQDLLSQNEFSFSYIQQISDRIKKTFSLDQLEDFDKIQRCVVDWIGESISIAPEKVYRKPHVIILVGPTGVGKTTTLVKLAALYLKKSQAKGVPAEFCFITTDTMRVGALEQLSRFGEIVGRSVLKAQTKEDVTKLYEEYKDNVDVIFIDTGGYGPNDAQHIADMKTTLSVQGLNADVYLTITASTKARDLNNIMQNYEPFGYQSVIITKCDESEQYGNVISVLNERHKNVAYVTNGQKITQTISRATVVEFLKRLEGFSVDRVHIEDKFNKDEEIFGV